MSHHQRVLISGGSGFIGQHLTQHLSTKGYTVVIVGRSQVDNANGTFETITWDELDAQAPFEIIINLAGASIAGKRWSHNYKKCLLDSRLITTQHLIRFCQKTEKPPSLFINASAIGFYGDQQNNAVTEVSEPADSFSHQLCQQWEDSISPLQESSLKENLVTRLCILRLGVVLDAKGGAFPQMAFPFKMKAAVRNGSGRQWFSWVALADAIRIIQWFIDTPNTKGPYNATAPEPLTNLALTKALSNHYRTLFNATLPAAAIKLLFGQMGEELLLASQKVIPERLLKEGFEFKHPDIASWLNTF